MKTVFVCTTIHHPANISEFVKNLVRHGHSGKTEFIVIGDRKSPTDTAAYLEKTCTKEIPVHYHDLPAQKKWLEKFPELDRVIPVDRIQRRNIGYLLACEIGATTIVSIDDDNFPLANEDYLAGHANVGKTARLRSYETKNGWYNVCEELITSPKNQFYHRGFPLKFRWSKDEKRVDQLSARVAVNAGFWLGDPDIDTFARLTEPFEVTGSHLNTSFTLARGTWSPFNSQNTAYLAEMLPALFLLIEGRPLKNLSVWRYDDIWMSYFARKIIDQKGDLVSYGAPWVRQKRNPHDFLLDLEREIMPLRLTNRLVNSLRQVSLTGTGSYGELYSELCEALGREFETSSDYDREEKDYFREMISNMKVWSKTCRELMGS
ncbi:MAG: hypothetical protein ABL958_19940 [Bdellovibrionia bacterium]